MYFVVAMYEVNTHAPSMRSSISGPVAMLRSWMITEFESPSALIDSVVLGETSWHLNYVT